MTTYESSLRACAVCQATNEQLILTSTNTFGNPDLDLRPPEMQRSTMNTWIQECPKCRYVNQDITEELPQAAALMRSAAYQDLLKNPEYPELANKFMRYSLLLNDDTQAVGTALLYAAWVCDDADKPAQAKTLRHLAADVLQKLLPVPDDQAQITIAVMLVDVLRRAERFEEAQSLASKLLFYTVVSENPFLQSVLNFQISRCQLGDTIGYTLDQCTTE